MFLLGVHDTVTKFTNSLNLRAEIIQNMFVDHNGIKLQINN